MYQKKKIIIGRYKGLTQFIKQVKEDVGITGIKDNDCIVRVTFIKNMYDIMTLQNINKEKVLKVKGTWKKKRTKTKRNNERV